MKLPLLVAAFAALCFPSTGLRAQTAAYTVIDLGTLGGTGSAAVGINDAGQVVGNSLITGNGATHAALFTVDANGTVSASDLGTLGFNSTARSVNANGLACGDSDVASDSGRTHAVLFHLDGTGITDLGTGGAPYVGSTAADISDNNVTVGGVASLYSNLSSSTFLTPAFFTLNGDGSVTTVVQNPPRNPNYPSSFYPSQLYAINALGQAAAEFQEIVSGGGVGGGGTYLAAFASMFDVTGVLATSNGSIYPDGNTTNPPNAAACAINNGPQLAGFFFNEAAIYTVSGSTLTPALLGYLGNDTLSVALGINDSAQAIGDSANASAVRGFLYTSAGGLQDLNALVGSSPTATAISMGTVASSADGTLNAAMLGIGRHLNNYGQIAATGIVSGKLNALLLNPTAPVVTSSSSMQTSYLLGGMKYSQIPAFTDTRSGTNLGTVVTFRDGTVGNRVIESAQFVNNPSSTTALASDAVSISGGTDIQVVQLTYDPTTAGTLFGNLVYARLCRYTGGSWIHNAVDTNTSGTPLFVGVRGYDFTQDFHLGRYGVDQVRHVVWAVVNHGGTLGVAMDPDTLKTLQSVTHSGTTSTLKISSFTGYTYTLQRAFSLTGTWSSDSVATAGTTGKTLTFTDFTTNTAAFYRILVGP